MKTKRSLYISLLSVVAAVFTFVGVGWMASARAETVSKSEFVSHFLPVGFTEYVQDVDYGEFAADSFSGSGVMVTTRNKAAELVDHTENSNSTNPLLIDFPDVKYPVGVTFDGAIDISDNTSDDTLIEFAFPAENNNFQARGFKVVIEDALNPNKYITLFIWSAYGNTTAYDSGKSHMLAAAVGTWETTNANSVANAAFDTDDYNNNGVKDDGVIVRVTSSGIEGDYGKDSNNKNKEICWLNAGSPHGHSVTSVNFSRTSKNTFKIQFDNETGILSVNGVRVRNFKAYSADGEHYFDEFTGDKVKVSLGVVRTVKGSTDEFTRFCIMNIDGNQIATDYDGNITYTGFDFEEGISETDKTELVSHFSGVGYTEFVEDISYENFSTPNMANGSGIMVTTRNKAAELVDHTENSNSTNPLLIDFPDVKYPVGVTFDGAIDISDNTSDDTLIEFAFPAENNNFQARGFKVVIEDASNPNKYITLFIWSAYGNTTAYDSGKSHMLAAAVGTWETTNANSVANAAFDTDDYNNNGVKDDGCIVRVTSSGIDGGTAEGGKEICWLNAGSPHGHSVTSVNFSRTSKNTFKIQFDNETGILSVNGVRVRNFKAYSADGEHYFDEFTGDKVKVSLGVVRTVKGSTDEFTRFCIMNIDGQSLKDDVDFEYSHEESEADKAELVSHFRQVGYTEFVEDVSYGKYSTPNELNVGGIMVTTRNKAADKINVLTGSPLISFPSVKYPVGVAFDGIIDVSDNTLSDTLLELSFPAENDNFQARGIKVIIEDASDPDKYIALYIWSAFGNGDAKDSGKSNILAAAVGTWESSSGTVANAGYDTDDYNNDGVKDDGLFLNVGDALDGDGAEGDKEGLYLNAGSPHGHSVTSVNFSRTSKNTIKVQFDNATGVLSINGVRVRDFKRYSADGEHYFDEFTSDKVKLSVGVVRTVKGSTDEFTRFCILNIDGIALKGATDKFEHPESVTDNDRLTSYFIPVGNTDYVQDVSFSEYSTPNQINKGVIITTRNKLSELVDHTETSNDTNPALINLPSDKYPVGVMIKDAIDISDNTSADTLLEIAFPAENDNFQARGIKVVIEDASNPDKYIALYIWSAFGNWDAKDSGKSNILAAAAGTWEKTIDGVDVYISEAGYDTDDYNNDGVTDDGCFIKVGNAVDGDGAEGDKEGLYLNAGSPHGHNVTSVNFSRNSQNTIKVQFDNSTGVLSINGVRVRDFKRYSADGEHYFDGFNNDEVKVSVGVVRTTKCSTDEFTKFSILNVNYHVNRAPASGFIASGNSQIPTPTKIGSLFYGEKELDAYTVNITDPKGKIVENYSAGAYDFSLIGTYSVEYFMKGRSLGVTELITAIKDDNGDLVEVSSFEIPDLYIGKTISLSDFIVMTDDRIEIGSSSVIIYKNDKVLANISDFNSYVIADKGYLTFKIVNDKMSLLTSSKVVAGLIPTGTIEHGRVIVDGSGENVGLVKGSHDFVIIPDTGYTFKSLKINGQDVSEEVFNNIYVYYAENDNENVTYDVTFEILPTVSVTFIVDGETVATIEGLLNGVLFGEIENLPEIAEKNNYIVKGWSLNDDFAITEDLYAEAVYEVKTYTITFDTDGGNAIAPKQYTAFDIVGEFDEIPVKTGYSFDGWYDGAEKFVFGSCLSSDITLKAKYSVLKLKITVKSDNFDDVIFTVDYNTSISIDNFGDKDGYTFNGIFTDKARMVKYDGANFTEDTVLYVAYDKNSGCGSSVYGDGLYVVALSLILAAAVVFMIKIKGNEKD